MAHRIKKNLISRERICPRSLSGLKGYKAPIPTWDEAWIMPGGGLEDPHKLKI
jgi:hypothetical protein